MTDGRRRVPSARTRILGWYVLLLAGRWRRLSCSSEHSFFAKSKARVNQDLDQEVGVRATRRGGDRPDDREPFAGDLAAVFTTYWNETCRSKARRS